MEILNIQYISEGKRAFYRFSSLNGDRVRDITIRGKDVDRSYRALFFELRSFYPKKQVELEFVGDFPQDRKEALEDLAVMHNAEIKK